MGGLLMDYSNILHHMGRPFRQLLSDHPSAASCLTLQLWPAPACGLTLQVHG